ncbi:MAG: glycine-rich domain-containing protein [Sulfuricellaceae bacterium]
MNNGLLGWPGSRKVLQQMCATNDVGNRQFWTSSTTWVVPAGVTRIRASALGGGGAGGYAGSGNLFSGSGGGGGLFLRGDLNVTPGETLTITVGTGGTGSTGAPGGSSMILQVGRAVIVASGGNGAPRWDAPAPDQAAYYFEGTPLVVVPGKGGGAGAAPNTGYSGCGGGGGGLSAQNTAGSAAAAGASSLSGSGSLGAMTPGGCASSGVAPPPGTPESGSGGGSSSGVGYAGAQGSGGSGGAALSYPGGNGGNGFVMVEY